MARPPENGEDGVHIAVRDIARIPANVAERRAADPELGVISGGP